MVFSVFHLLLLATFLYLSPLCASLLHLFFLSSVSLLLHFLHFSHNFLLHCSLLRRSCFLPPLPYPSSSILPHPIIFFLSHSRHFHAFIPPPMFCLPLHFHGTPPPLYFIPTLSFPSCFLFLYTFPPFSLRWHAPDPTDSPDRGTEPEPAAVRPVQRPPGAECSKPPYPSTPAARPSTPSYTAHGCLASSSVSGSARVAGAAVPDSGRAAAGPGEVAGSRGGAGCCEPAPTAADAAPNTASAANTASHAAWASRE